MIENSRSLGMSALLLALVTVSCTRDSYQLTLWNKRPAPLREAAIEFPSRRIGFGIVIPGTEAGVFPIELELPEHLTVVWEEEDGKQVKVGVDLGDFVDRRRPFHGEVHVIVNPDDSVSVVPFRQEGGEALSRSFLLNKAIRAAPDGRALVPHAPI